ncbi:Uncharacterized protein OBRU01_15994, partial [Operophtera brumata]
ITSDTLNGLRNLGIDVNSWDTIVIYLVTSKLDAESRKLWETKIGSSDELPALKELKEFLETRFRSLEFTDDHSLLRKIRERESLVPEKKILTSDEERCEEIYTHTTVRDESGRSVVNLPFRTSNPECKHGRTRDLAVRRFQHLERKVEREPEVTSPAVHRVLET